MKKILALLLSMLLVLSLFSACTAKDDVGQEDDNLTDQNTNTSDDEDVNNEEQNDSADTPDEEDQDDTEDTPDNADQDDTIDTPDDSNKNDTTNKPDNGNSNSGNNNSGNGSGGNGSMSGNENGNTTDDNAILSGSLSEIIDQIYEKKPFSLPLMTQDIDLENADSLKYNTGLTSADMISAAAVSETMMGSQAYSMVLVRVKNSSDAQSVAEAMKNGIDTRKWICVGADEMRVVAYEDLILLVMMDSQYADIASVDELVEAFGTVCGGEFSVDL